MAFNVTAKATSNNSTTPSRNIARQEVNMGQSSATSSRVAALKAKLQGQTPSQPVAPRPMGSTARREEMAKLQKFSQQTTVVPKTPQRTSRPVPGNLENIAPPPSGAVQTNPSIEAPKPAPEARKEQLDPQYAALARQEQQLRKARQEFKAAQEAWKQEQAKYIPKDRITSETLKVLSEAGITADKLVELQLNQAAPPDSNQILLDKIALLEQKLTEVTDPENGMLAKRDQQAYDQAVSQIRSDARLLVDSNPSYGTIKSEGQTEEVVNLITTLFNEEGTVLDVEEAAQLVEDKLIERITKQYERFSKYEKIKSKFGKRTENSAEAMPEPGKVKQSQNTTQVTTLTNAGATMHPLSPRDRAVRIVQEALDARKGR